MPAQSFQPQVSSVLGARAADPAVARAHFAAKLALETDPSDVHADLQKSVQGFVVVDCRRPESYAKGHVPGAINIPYRTISAESVTLPRDTVLVTYCTGISCNASTKGALRFAELGYRVKEMIGGIEGWKGDGFAVATGSEPGKLT